MKSVAQTRFAPPLLAFVAGGMTLLSASLASAADTVSLGIDESHPVVLDHAVATLSVGNPDILGVSMQNDKMLFLLGRTYGYTNIVGLDSDGKVVYEANVHVVGPQDGALTLNRGIEQLSFNCAPRCEHTLMPGDEKDTFNTLSSQIGTKTGMSEDAASKK